MSYYSGDFYRGDFYRGDPGFFGSLFGLAQKAAGFIPGVGGVVSGVMSGIKGSVTGGGLRSTAMIPAGTSMMRQAGTSLARRTVAAVKGHPILSAAGAAGVIGAGGVMAGRHLGKINPRTGLPRKHRRMNPCNPRALRRAIRRTHGFAKLAMKTIHIVHPKKKGHFGGFKKRVRRG